MRKILYKLIAIMALILSSFTTMPIVEAATVQPILTNITANGPFGSPSTVVTIIGTNLPLLTGQQQSPNGYGYQYTNFEWDDTISQAIGTVGGGGAGIDVIVDSSSELQFTIPNYSGLNTSVQNWYAAFNPGTGMRNYGSYNYTTGKFIGLPNPPSGLNAAIGDKTVYLSWSPVQYASSYKVYRSGTLIASGVTGTSYTNSGLTDGTSYDYTVAGVNSVGTGFQSSPVTATPLAVQQTTPQPTNVDYSGTSGGTGTVTWEPGANTPSGTTYTVYQNSQSIGSTTGTSFTISNYDLNSVYTVSAQALGYLPSTPVGRTINYGLTGEDVFTNAVAIVFSLAGLLLLALTIEFAPRLIDLLKEHPTPSQDNEDEINQEEYKRDWPDASVANTHSDISPVSFDEGRW